MAFCPSVCQYRVTFSDGTVIYPKLPGSVDVYRLAEQYAIETLSKDAEEPVLVTLVELLH